MNIKENKIDELNLELTLQIEHADYAEAKRKKLADFRRKALGFLRKYDRDIPDRHQSQRCIKCFHCVAECRNMVFIVNELAALTAIADDLRDWECQNI